MREEVREERGGGETGVERRGETWLLLPAANISLSPRAVGIICDTARGWTERRMVKHRLCLVFALPSWLRHRLCLVFALPSWLRHRLS